MNRNRFTGIMANNSNRTERQRSRANFYTPTIVRTNLKAKMKKQPASKSELKNNTHTNYLSACKEEKRIFQKKMKRKKAANNIQWKMANKHLSTLKTF